MSGDGLRYALGRSSLGVVGIVAGERGVRAIEVGDDEVSVRATLLARYRGTPLAEDADGLGPWLAAVVAALDDPTGAACLPASVPFDPAGTAFQRSVWDALVAIPPGTTRTYAQLAEAIGRPTAARAVARACATNELAVVVPCHRIVRGDGSLGGYRWGVERKRALLDRERGAAPRG